MGDELARVLERGPTAFALVDAEGVLRDCNETLTTIFGMQRSAMIGTAMWQMGPNLDRDAWYHLRARAERDGSTELDLRGPQCDRTYRAVRLRIEQVTEPGGPIRFLMTGSTQPPTAEAEPREEQWFRMITRFGEDGFWAWRYGAERVALHPRWYAKLGLEPRQEESVAELWSRVHPDDIDPMKRALGQLTRGEVDRVATRLRFRHADGSWRWFRNRAFIIARNPDDSPAWLMGHDVDITAEVEAESRALERERELSQLLDRIATAVFVFDNAGRLKRWNRAAERIGGDRAGLLSEFGERSARGWHGLDGDSRPMRDDELPLYTALRTGQPVWNQVIGMDRRGERRWGLISAVPSCDERGEVIDVVCTVTDITAARHLERALAQRQRFESLGRLAGGVAHDFNNLLTVIASSAELIAGELPLGSLARDDIAEVRAAAERGAALTRQLLGYARLQPRNPRLVRLSEHVRQSEGLMRRLLPARARLDVRAPRQLWPVRIDRSQVDQIVMNLTTNAGDALVDGRGVVTVTLRNTHHELDPHAAAEAFTLATGDYVVLTVTDDGRGMDPDVLRRATEPFFTTKPVGAGSGLGLSTCLGIARQNDGSMRIVSAPGSGTAVEVWLPRAEGEEIPRPPPEARATLPPGAVILIVEDERAVREAAWRALTRDGAVVHVADDGHSARALVERGLAPDLVVCDVVLPDLDGPALVDRMRQLQPSLPVLYISGHDDPVLADCGIDRTRHALLAKPFTALALRRRVIDLLERPEG